jgi:hypothetical protein
MDGKNSERVLMRVTPEMKQEVEALAHFEGRPVNHQYRRLIMIGLEQVRANGSNGIRRSSRQLLSTGAELSSTSSDYARPKPMRRTA